MISKRAPQLSHDLRAVGFIASHAAHFLRGVLGMRRLESGSMRGRSVLALTAVAPLTTPLDAAVGASVAPLPDELGVGATAGIVAMGSAAAAAAVAAAAAAVALT